MINALLNRQDGVALLMVIAFMALSIPLLAGSLAFANTLNRDSVVKTEILKRQYAALGGSQWGDYLNQEDAAAGCYLVDLNGDSINVCVGEAPVIVSEPPPADNSRRLFTSIVVDPTIGYPAAPAPPEPVPQQFTYTITVTDRDDEPENLTKIHAVIPPGFSYVDDSTTLVTTGNPSIQGQKLTWNLAPLSITLLPGQFRQLSFMAEAVLFEGNYCAEAWAEPGQVKTGTGLDALISVWAEDPESDLCTGAALSLDKTVYVHPGTVYGSEAFGATYTLVAQNTGTLPLHVSQVRDLLSEGFSYTPGTAYGALVNGAEPVATIFQGRQRLDWAFDPPLIIPSGETWTGTYSVSGQFNGGHWNEAWLTLNEFADTQYTWPTAGIEVIDADESTTTTSDGTEVYSLIWQIGPESYVIWSWGSS